VLKYSSTFAESGLRRILTSWQLLLLVSITVRLAFVVSLDTRCLTWDDEREHHQIAWNLAQTGRFESSAYRAAPLYPTFLAVVYKVFGHNFLAARVCQALLGAILTLVVFRLAVLLFDRTTALVAGWCTALYPQFIYLTGVFYAEHTFAVLLALTVLSLVRHHDKPSPRRATLAGISMAATILCRPIGFAFVPFAGAYIFVSASSRSKLRCLAVFIAVTSLVVLPWTIRNAFVYWHFVPVATGQGMHLWMGNNDLSRGDADDRHLNPSNRFWMDRIGQPNTEGLTADKTHAGVPATGTTRLDEIEQDRALQQEAFRWARTHPRAFLRNSLRRLLTLHEAFSRTLSTNETTSTRNQLIASLTFYPVLTLGLIGAFLALRRNRASWILHAVVCSLTMIHLPMTACTRFRLPWDPYWIIFAAVAVVVFARSGLAWRDAHRAARQTRQGNH
jgi:4-amino-4-deoxy-L-arabinose transferase-like glycosyltransferase